MNHGTDFDFGIDSIAYAQFGNLLPTPGEKWLVEAAMHVAAFQRQAGLTSVHESRPKSAAGGNFQIGIVEHDHGIFAAQFQHHRQQAARGGFAYPFSSGNASGEHQLVDGRLDQRCSGRALADDDLHQDREASQQPAADVAIPARPSGVSSEGFSTTALPVTSAPSVSMAGMENG